MKKDDKVSENEVAIKDVNHTEKIKSQVLAKIGNPPRLHRMEVSKHHNRNYRVNIWQRSEPDKNTSPVIAWSYYLELSDTGEIISSNPPLVKI